MKRICVFIGSSIGKQTNYILQTKQLAKELVKRDIELVYGGAKVGLMGILADTVLELGGHVIGVIPKGLTHKEIVHDNLTQLKIVSSMHERKEKMSLLASGFIALPGGIGTLEEISEILTWAQLGIHNKPCGLLNTSGYYKHFIAQLDNMVKEGFLKEIHRSLLIENNDIVQLLDSLENYQKPNFKTWLTKKES